MYAGNAINSFEDDDFFHLMEMENFLLHKLIDGAFHVQFVIIKLKCPRQSHNNTIENQTRLRRLYRALGVTIRWRPLSGKRDRVRVRSPVQIKDSC